MKYRSEYRPNKRGHIDNLSPKSMVFFTHSALGTLGDASAASKLIKELKKKDRSIHLYIVLIVDKVYQNKTENFFKDIEGVEVISMIPGSGSPISKDLKTSALLDKILTKTDGIVFFPTFHFFSLDDIKAIGAYKKPTFIVTEYNLYEENRQKQTNNIKKSNMQCVIINTGLGPDKLGIFCTDENKEDISTHQPPLSSIMDESDAAFRDLLLSDNSDEIYHNSHQLFFGYFNKNRYAQKQKEIISPSMFIGACLSRVRPSIDIVDIVLPFENIFLPSFNNILDEFSAYLKENPALLKEYRIEFWSKNNEGTMDDISGKFKIKMEGETDEFQGIEKLEERTDKSKTKLIRLINGYPFTPDTMVKLMKASDPFVLVTGDQSLSEAISNQKIFLYQTMPWKIELWEALKMEVEKELGEESDLYQFLRMQDGNLSLENFNLFFQQYEKAYLEQMKAFHQYIMNEKNLYHTLPMKLIEYIENPRLYAQDCLGRKNPAVSVKNTWKKLGDGISLSTLKRRLHVTRIPPEERVAHGEAVLNALVLLNETTSSKIISDIEKIIREINFLSEKNVSNSLEKIKRRIKEAIEANTEEGEENYNDKKVQAVFSAFQDPSHLTFKKILDSLYKDIPEIIQSNESIIKQEKY